MSTTQPATPGCHVRACGTLGRPFQLPAAVALCRHGRVRVLMLGRVYVSDRTGLSGWQEDEQRLREIVTRAALAAQPAPEPVSPCACCPVHALDCASPTPDDCREKYAACQRCAMQQSAARSATVQAAIRRSQQPLPLTTPMAYTPPVTQPPSPAIADDVPF